MRKHAPELAPAPLVDMAELEDLRIKAERARHGERARAKERVRIKAHDILRREVGMPTPNWWRSA